MELINQTVEFWDDRHTSIVEHIARCAAVCYRSETYDPMKLYKNLIEHGHLSMLRHGTKYYIVPNSSYQARVLEQYYQMCDMFDRNPYISLYKDSEGTFYMSTNMQFCAEHPVFDQFFYPYLVSADHMWELALKDEAPKNILRLTFACTTSIKVSRELNRVSPNNIAEQSTRYVNFLSKCGDVAVVESLDNHLSKVQSVMILEELERSTEKYKYLIGCGIKPEDARRVLPLDTATKVVYTYTLAEWMHILDLRYYGKTGKPAPDAHYIASLIHDHLVVNNLIDKDNE